MRDPDHRRAYALALFAALLMVSALARAAEHPPVALHVAACLGTSEAEIRRVVALELRATLVPDLRAGDDATRVTVDCHNPHVVLEVEDPITGKALRRSYDLSSVARVARSRSIALAVVELVSASWSELELHDQPALTPVEATASQRAREAVRDVVRQRVPSQPRFRVVGFGSWQASRDLNNLLGGGVRVGLDLSVPLSLTLEAAYAAAENRSTLGNIDASVASAAVGAYWRQRVFSAELRTGALARLGTASMQGSPFDPAAATGATVSGAWWAPALSSSVSLSLSERVVIEAAGEVGAVLVPVFADVDQGRSVALDGAWFSASVGMGFTL